MNTKNKPVILVALLCLFSMTMQQFATAQSSFSGEQLFAGIYFNDGPVIDKVPVLKKFGYKNYVSDSKVLEAASRFQREITNSVRIKYPYLFDDLKKEIESGDHARINTALEKNSSKVYGVMLDFMRTQTGAPKASSEAEDLSQLKSFVNSYVTGVNPNDDPQALIGIVWVAVVAWEWVWVSDEFILRSEVAEGGGLKKEQLVAELAAL